MAHRATIYNVYVHKKNKPKERLPFGKLDDKGTFLGDVLKEILDDDFAVQSSDGNRAVRTEETTVVNDDLQALFTHGEGGVVADIMDSRGQLRIRMNEDDTALIRCGSLIRLPRNRTLGFWAVHVNNGRGVKGLAAPAVIERFRNKFPGLRLKIAPAVLRSVLEEALEKHHLESVTLVKYDRGADITEAQKWVEQGTTAQVEVRFKPMERAKTLVPDVVINALTGQDSAKKSITEFRGVTFDEAKVQVSLKGGSRRTFTLQRLESGHPFAAEISPETDRGEPKSASLFNELGKVIAEME
jgi:hypothetical protein